MKAPHLLHQIVRSLLDRSKAAKKRLRPRLCGFEPLEPRMVLSASLPMHAGGNSGLHRNDWKHVEVKDKKSEAAEFSKKSEWATEAAIRKAAERAERTEQRERHERVDLPVARTD